MGKPFDAKAARTKRPLPLWMDSLMRDTMLLEPDEFGAYIKILCAMWGVRSAALPNDQRKLSRAAGVSLRLWNSRIGPALEGYWTECEEGITQKRLRKEAAYVERQVTNQSDRKRAENPDKSLENNDTVQSTDISTDVPTVNPSQQPNNPTVKKEEPNGSLSSDAEDVVTALDVYNAAAEEVGWPKVMSFTKARRSALSARLRECGGLAGWDAAILKAKHSSHLCGQNDRGWLANFDFITRQSSFAKLMEGNYDNRSGISQISSRSKDRPDPALEQIARLSGISSAQGNGRS